MTKDKMMELTKAEEEYINNAANKKEAEQRIRHVYSFEIQRKIMDILISSDLVLSTDKSNREKLVESLKNLPSLKISQMSLSVHEGIHAVDSFLKDTVLMSIASMEKINLVHDWRKCLEETLDFYDAELKQRG